MKIRQVLADRLRELMSERPALDTQEKVAKLSGLGQSTIQRILTCQSSATVDAVAAIAKAFSVSPASLVSFDVRTSDLIGRWGQLSDTDKARVLAFIEVSVTPLGMPSSLDFERRTSLPSAQQIAVRRESSKSPNTSREVNLGENVSDGNKTTGDRRTGGDRRKIKR